MRLVGIGSIAFIILVLFGKVYSWATRPVAPVQVTLLLRTYAPGVSIGEPVEQSRKHLPDLRFVPLVGFVGANANAGRDPKSSNLFPQVRLLLDAKARSRQYGAQRAKVDAVELLTGSRGGIAMLQTELVGLFGMPAGTGCLRTGTPGNFRDVTWWATPARRGGAVLVEDFRGNAQPQPPGQPVVSLLLYRGEFKGGETLRGVFEERECRKLARAAAGIRTP